METKFNFKSAICTSRVQSERLLKLGLKKETADMWYPHFAPSFPIPLTEDDYVHELNDDGDVPAWSIHRLMEMVDPWEYKNWIGEDIENDYDNMIQCISFLIDDRRFNKEYLVDQDALEERCKGVLEYLDYIREED